MYTTLSEKLSSSMQPKDKRCRSSSVVRTKRWLARIRRRHTLASMQAEKERKNSMVHDYERLYHVIEEELIYAVESQGSIYYADDFRAVQDALNAWLERYNDLTRILTKSELATLDAQWEATRMDLQCRLDTLPPI
ncbi:hypothetical protein VTP01DRAFT_9148 [Rhizomucor pusillus]|uniref:uncharacterized protein n=1 Tax=Rhizomucor pusillus TaxID=4840 RepID=UPI0037432CBB